MKKLVASPDVVEKRWNICKSCPHLRKVKICDVCNCIMPFKTKLKKASCPIGKW